MSLTCTRSLARWPSSLPLPQKWQGSASPSSPIWADLHTQGARSPNHRPPGQTSVFLGGRGEDGRILDRLRAVEGTRVERKQRRGEEQADEAAPERRGIESIRGGEGTRGRPDHQYLFQSPPPPPHSPHSQTPLSTMVPLREFAKKIPYEAYPILATVAFSLSFMVRSIPAPYIPRADPSRLPLQCYTGVHTLHSALDVSVYPQKQDYRPWMTVDPNDVPSMRFRPREERRKQAALFPSSLPPFGSGDRLTQSIASQVGLSLLRQLGRHPKADPRALRP